jgi:hypothetical protein
MAGLSAKEQRKLKQYVQEIYIKSEIAPVLKNYSQKSLLKIGKLLLDNMSYKTCHALGDLLLARLEKLNPKEEEK